MIFINKTSPSGGPEHHAALREPRDGLVVFAFQVDVGEVSHPQTGLGGALPARRSRPPLKVRFNQFP